MQGNAPRLARDHIRPGDRVCAAVSGGADSVAMLLLLYAENRLAKNALGVGLSAVHVHHGLRGAEADADQAFVEELCLRLEIPLHVERTNVPERLAAGGNPERRETVEEAARILRYEAFERLIGEGKADSVLTAHTQDDQAETVVMKLLRGAWTEGLGGVYPMVVVSAGGRAGKLVRPLLGCTRAQLETYVQARGETWRTDSSNSDDAFTRNRIRHHLLPMLREYNPAIAGTLAALAELARDEEARWQAELARMLPEILLPGRPVRGGGRAVGMGTAEVMALELERLRGLDRATLRRVLRAAAREIGFRINFADTNRLLEMATEPGVRPGAKLRVCGGLRVERSARELRLSSAPERSEG